MAKRKSIVHVESPLPQLLPKTETDMKSFEFPFENIVFEGGGARGAAYYGVIKVLEEVGLRDQIKRVAGASAGAMTALLFVVGCTGDQLRHMFTALDFRSLMDVPSPCFCFGNFGRRSGDKIYNYFGKVIKEKHGKKDLTFLELYRMTGRELCIIVTNVNYMDIEYCHPKTTPNLPIRLAVRMSLSIPVEFNIIRHNAEFSSYTDIYTDGGLLCNFPVHCFDGWFLSMKPEDNFFSKLKAQSTFNEKFGDVNWKTIGCLLYSDNDAEILSMDFKHLDHQPSRTTIDSRLFRKYQKKKLSNQNSDCIDCWEERVKASEVFIKVLRKYAVSGRMSYSKLEEALTESLKDPDSALTERHLALLFGEESSLASIMDMMDYDHNGELSFEELIRFMGHKGVDMRAISRGYERRNVNTFMELLTTLLDSFLINNQRLYIKPEDSKRTIGIDTLYLNTTDFDMEENDKEFLVKQGARVTIAFLRRHMNTATVIKEELALPTYHLCS